MAMGVSHEKAVIIEEAHCVAMGVSHEKAVYLDFFTVTADFDILHVNALCTFHDMNRSSLY